MRKPYYFKLVINGAHDKTYTRWLANDEWKPMFYLVKAFTNVSLQDLGIVFDHYDEDMETRTLTLYYESYKEPKQENTTQGDSE